MASVKLPRPPTSRGTATVPAIARTRTLDAGQDRARQLLERDLQPSQQSPILGGVFASAKTPDYGSSVDVIHRLGRTPQGWIVVDRLDAPFVLWHEPLSADQEKNVIRLVRNGYTAPGDGGSVDALFKIYVF